MGSKNQEITYFKYCRKSTEAEDKQVLSLDSQSSELTKIEKREQLKIIVLPTESKSAKAPGVRKVFDNMLDRIEKGEANGILVWHADRLSRNSMDTGMLIYLMDQGKLLEIKTPTQIFRNTPNDKFLFSILGGAAKLENDNKGINVKRGLKKKCEMGWYPTVAPVGYKNDSLNEKGIREVKVDLDRFDLVRKMFDLMLKGTYTAQQIKNIATQQWGFTMRKGHKMSRNMIYRIFTEPFYYGEFEYPRGSGTWYKGKHKAMITTEEYDRIQILLGRKGRHRPKKYNFTFKGMLRCGDCGGMITSEEKKQIICPECKVKFSSTNHDVCPGCGISTEKMKNPTLLHYIYYHCTKRKDPNCKQKAIEEKQLQKQISDILERLRFPEEFHEWAMKHFRESNKTESAGRNKILFNLKNEYAQCMRKIDGLINMRVNNELTESEFREKKRAMLKEKERLHELLNDTGKRVDKWLDAAENVFKFAEHAQKKFETGDMEVKRQILSALGSNLTLKNKRLTIKMENTLFTIEKVSSRLREKNKMFEPNFYRRENTLKLPEFTKVLRDENSSQTITIILPNTIHASKRKNL